jgi:CheY-like chemotaxis protein
MLEDIYNINILKAEGKGISLAFDVDPGAPDALKGDEMRLSRVINNILSNAVKFTPRGGSVKLSVKMAADCGDKPAIDVTVEDDGIGISGENIKKLFKPFVQADASVYGKYGGTGLGLAICKNIVEQMGGRLGVTSEIGKGSRFFFRIPVEPGSLPPEEASQETGPREYDLSGKRLLIAEDIDINRDIVKELLGRTGVEIDFALNGREAVDMFALSPDRYDMIYMDLRMPEMNGYEATSEIRRSGLARAEDIPIVAMTANAFAEDVERCMSAGMNDHIAKPIDMDILLEKTAKYTCHKA